MPPMIRAEVGAELVLSATSDAFSGTYRLSVLTDEDGQAIALRGEDARTADFPIADLQAGFTILNQSGRDIILLQSSNFDPWVGGTLRLTYLVNGITGKYRSVEIDLLHDGSTWGLATNDQAGRRAVSTGYFKANRMLGRVVGIDSVRLQ